MSAQRRRPQVAYRETIVTLRRAKDGSSADGGRASRPRVDSRRVPIPGEGYGFKTPSSAAWSRREYIGPAEMGIF